MAASYCLPSNRLSFAMKYCNVIKLPISAGIEDVKKFLPMSNSLSPVKSPKLVGIGPSKINDDVLLLVTEKK